jgi:hypothetical protein
LQQGERKSDQHHAQHNRSSRTPQNAFGAKVGRQLAARQRDDHRVIAAQQDVDHDDLTYG